VIVSKYIPAAVNKLVGIVYGVAWLVSCASEPARSSESAVPANDPPVEINERPIAARFALPAEDAGGDASPPRGCDGGILAKGDKVPPMKKPRLLFSAPIAYSEKAAALSVSGVALVKCVIELDGFMSDCRIVKGLPFLNDQILASVQTWKYTPITWCGHPQRVEMIVPIRMRPPDP
jgi:outer membrane biosynthesis protein TonB